MFLPKLIGTAKAMIILAGLALSLTACGVKGPLEAPPEAQTESDAPASVKEEKPHRGFILDGLLN
jgi:predicted small lipoprotein YifL